MKGRELKKDQLRTWIEIDKSAIAHNYKLFRSIIPKKTLLCGVVKSNAYGHGLVEFAKTAERHVDMFAVDSIIEGIHLREEGIKKPIFVLGYVLPSMLLEAAKHNIAVTVSSFDSLKEVVNIKKKLDVHVKVDSGMSRQGFFVKDMEEVCGVFKKNKHLTFKGIYTHFADAKNPAFPANTYKQKEEFDKAVKVVKESFDPVVHCAASSTTILFPEMHEDMVRVGISSYGLWPAKEVQAYAEDIFPLKPVMKWVTVVADVKEIPSGRGVSYGFTERVKKKTKIGILPVGYWHGYDRKLSSIGHVVINGKKARVLGRVTMDMIIVDLSKHKTVQVGDEAILLGGEMTADEIAYLTDTVNYEIVTRTNPKIRRIVV